MKTIILMLSAAGALVASDPASAGSRAIDTYVKGLDAAAAREITAARTPVGDGLEVTAWVNPRGRLTNVRVVDSSGSPVADRKVTDAFRRVSLAGPPMAVLNGELHFTVRPAELRTASID